jgi:hypothetical protein
MALVCHPHPLFGGTMHNKVVYRLARGLRASGAVVLRFNFRGVGRSEGEHHHGVGEIEDARAAWTWQRERYPGLRQVLAGFSFGSRVILKLGCNAPEKPLLVAVGFPAGQDPVQMPSSCGASKVFIQSTNDEFAPREKVEELYARVEEPKRLVWIEASDHFFQGGLDRLEETASGLLDLGY